MRLSLTLSAYLARQYAFWLASVFCILMGIALLFDLVEMMRRASGKEDATMAIVLQMSLFKLPHLAETILPFTVLFGAMFAFWRLANANEIVVSRSAGVSIWQFLFPAVICTLVVGIFQITIFNPFSAIMLSKFESIEAKYLKRTTSMLAVSRNGLWLRQSDSGGQAVIHALRVSQAEMKLHDVIVFMFEGSDKFVGRIDAETAQLKIGYWDIRDGWISTPNRAAHKIAKYELPSDLTLTKIQESFASPETMSFWDLPDFIEELEASGFSGHRHRLHLHSLIALPVLLCAMVLIAAAFTVHINRRSGAFFALIGGVAISFLLYVLGDVVYALGLSTNVPTQLAAWTPAGVTMMIGLALLLHLEDG
ncbi:MAG: LPS export ABC transporter permease LptG [Candidatus Latescibacterota bacterium]